ncbi:MAG: ISAs1 family transposase [Azospirillum sp.]|nr:ISAs1 family transposase [Azospirillum sp.]
MEVVVGKARLRSLLEHFGELKDCREPAKVRYPLSEVLFLVVAATIAGCDDYDEIALWGETHRDFLRRFSEYYFGTPGEDWLRVLMNRIDPALFQACFTDWARKLRPDAADLIAIDGKTSRRSHDRGRGQKPLHLVSAFATTQRLVLAQEAVDEKENECGVIPEILDRLNIEGALVTIDAIACNPKIAAAITDRKADYILAVKANQPTLNKDIAIFFADHASEALFCSDVDKDHGRIETRRVLVSHNINWLLSGRRYPDEPRFPTLASIIMVESIVETKGNVHTERRYYISSATLTPERAAEAIRGHWRVETSLHWVLDVTFKEDQSGLRRGHGARNMAVVRHFSINLIRLAKGKHSIKTTRKAAGWNPDELARILNVQPR